MDALLGRSSFLGPSIDVTAFTGSFLSQAHFDGCIAFTNWPRTDVEKLLPPEIELAVNTSSTPELHPVTFIFGEVSDGATTLGGFRLPLGVNYQEFATAIPFVKYRQRHCLHTYVARMYSSYSPATWIGNAYYGFSKEMAKMWWQGPIFLITTEEGVLLLHAAVETEGLWSRGHSCTLRNFAEMQGIFALPIVGRKATGEYVCSYFGWDFSDALVRPADACISIDAPLIAGLTPRRCHDVPDGTFEVRGMIWRLSWPASCPSC
jgi:hypothetical protein